MNFRISNPFYHVMFWLVVTGILTLIFGRSWGSGINSFYFVSMLLPVVMGTSYFFNYYLVPNFLLKKKYFFFALHMIYMVVISLYLQMIVIFFSFVYLANFNFSEMGLNSGDVIMLAVVMYLVVFVGSFLVMLQQLAERQKEIEYYRTEQKKRENAFLELLSNRQLVRIPYNEITYIESLSDYIKVHSDDGKRVTSKEKISKVAELLPEQFIRIHRSFIVNKEKVTRFNANEVELNGIQLNIGRSFKPQVLLRLKAVK
jgi:two-component system, LytTR family, response regulator LytT